MLEGSKARQAARDQAVIEARLLPDSEAADLEKKPTLSREQQIELERWRIDRDWCLKGRAPTLDVLEQHRDGAQRRLRRRFWLTDGSGLVAGHDKREAARLGSSGEVWGPDLTGACVGPQIEALKRLAEALLVMALRPLVVPPDDRSAFSR